MPQLYSYIRWSSDRQDKGTTKSRQVAAAKAYAEEAGLELVEIIDPGVSAFRGKNRAGKLGDFIDAVKIMLYHLTLGFTAKTSTDYHAIRWMKHFVYSLS